MPAALATAVAATATAPPLKLPAPATRWRLRPAAQRRHVILVAVLLVGRPGSAVAAPPGEQAPTPWDLEGTDVGSFLQIRAYNQQIHAYDDYFGRSEQLLSAIEADLGAAAPPPPPGWPGLGAAAAGAYSAPDGDAAAPILRRPRLRGLAAPDAASPVQPADIQTIAREAALLAIEATLAKQHEIQDPVYTTQTTTTHFLDGITRSHWFPYAFVAFVVLVVLPCTFLILTQCSATDLLLFAAVT